VNEILATALAFCDAGYAVVPARADGSKAPAGSWERYQSELPPREQVTTWLANGTYDGFGLVCGAVSGGLEMLELEGRAIAEGVHVAYRDALAAHGLSELWQRVSGGYAETTPSGGLHILYRVGGTPRPNTKLARTAAAEVLIETRGEGGFTIVAPSAGHTHPTGKPWQIARGGPATIATISEEERDALHAVASTLDRSPVRQVQLPRAATAGQDGRPGDDYNARAAWQDILGPHEWRPVRKLGDGAIGWCRPGKQGAFISATTRETGGLYVFSTSTPFDTETPYSKFAACAVLNHGGDYAAAARQLRRDGYGAPRERDDDGISDLVATKPVGSPAMASATSATTAILAASWAGDLAKLLDDVYGFLGRFIAYPSKHAHLAHALWIAHTHVMDAWESTPRIAFLSPEPGSGKTRALEVSELLVPRPVEAVNTTPAYLFRKVSDQAGLPTILYDEIDTLFGPKAKDNEEIRGMLNAGHRRGAVAGRCVVRGKVVETEELPAYCALALAGLGGLPDTLLTRSVVVRMKRRAPDEKVEPFRRRVHLKDGNALRDQLAAWGTSAVEDLGGKWPEMPAGVEDRDADVWEALLAIADAAGGVWPAKARAASVALVADAKAATPSLGIRLLADIRAVWDATDAMHTETLLDALNKLDEAPWGDLRGKPLDPRRLSRFMRDYDVHPADVRADVDGEEKVRKGYKREDLHDAWLRYLPPLPTCAACGERMTVIEEGQTTHPGCGTELTP
jgi:hypothetical protein